MQNRVEVFQLLFSSGEVGRLVSHLIRIGEEQNGRITSNKFVKHFIFEHTFHFDYESVMNFSKNLGELMLYGYDEFKDILKKIIYRIAKRIIAIKGGIQSMWMDIQQIRIDIVPYGIPFGEGRCAIDKTINFGRFTLVSGRIVKVEETEMKIIRYLFKCADDACGKMLYKCKNEIGRNVICKCCRGPAHEKDTGHIIISSSIIWIQVEGTFSFSPIKCTLNHERLISNTYKVGESIDLFGIFKFNHGGCSTLKVIDIENIEKKGSGPCHYFGSDFNGVMRMIEEVSPNLDPSLKRLLLFVMVTCVTGGSLIIKTSTFEEQDVILKICSELFDFNVVYPMKKKEKNFGPPLISGTNIIIPHINSLSLQSLDMLMGNISKGEVKGALVNTVICVAVDSDISSFSSFDLSVRLSNHPPYTLNDLRNCTGIIAEAIKKFKKVSLNDHSVEILSQYALKSSGSDLLRFAKAICSLRGSTEITEIDALLSVYLSEERKNSIYSDNYSRSPLPPAGFSFFGPEESNIPSSDQFVLFSAWRSRILKCLYVNHD